MYIEFKDDNKTILNFDKCIKVTIHKDEIQVITESSGQIISSTLIYTAEDVLNFEARRAERTDDYNKIKDSFKNEDKFLKSNDGSQEIKEKAKYMITINGKLLDRNDVLHALLEGDYTVKIELEGRKFNLKIDLLGSETLVEDNDFNIVIDKGLDKITRLGSHYWCPTDKIQSIYHDKIATYKRCYILGMNLFI